MTSRAATGLSLLVAMVLLGGCGADDSADSPEPTRSVVTSAPPSVEPVAACDEILGADVWSALGWQAPTEVGESSGRCRGSSADGTLLVGERLDLAASGDAAAATSALEEVCADLSEGEAVVETDPEWLGEGDACVRHLLEGQSRGEVEMFMVTSDAAVVQIQAVVVRETTQEQLREGLTLLVGAAESLW
jgi:hypothetical protein